MLIIIISCTSLHCVKQDDEVALILLQIWSRVGTPLASNVASSSRWRPTHKKSIIIKLQVLIHKLLARLTCCSGSVRFCVILCVSLSLSFGYYCIYIPTHSGNINRNGMRYWALTRNGTERDETSRNKIEPNEHVHFFAINSSWPESKLPVDWPATRRLSGKLSSKLSLSCCIAVVSVGRWARSNKMSRTVARPQD